jgi:hypothetical protein
MGSRITGMAKVKILIRSSFKRPMMIPDERLLLFYRAQCSAILQADSDVKCLEVLCLGGAPVSQCFNG